ncbi:MAG: gamma-glutamyltransferase [Schleiferiaceae bacterium]|jgi:gamma-glutamyltranspeptidase/glutathione hydrolase
MRLLLLAISTISFLSLSAQDRVNGATFQTRSPVLAEHGMVCTSHPLASQIGLDILKQGGNAIDAAIAANAALGLMEPTGCGVGGDLFAIVWDAKTQKLYGLNGSGRSPKSMSLDTLKAMGLEKIPAYGPLPVSVPGAVDGWTSLHDKFGSMPLKKILAPAIGYAEEGFPVTELIGYYLGSIDRFSRMGYPNIKETYYDPNGGERPKNGDRYRNPALADTYRAIAKKGREGFYEGEVAQTITTFIKEQGGFLSLEDLSSHHSQWVEPVSVNYRGFDVWELPPNGQGIAALQLLNILENKDFSEVRWGSEEHLHLFTEAKKRVFEDRAKYYADMDMAEVPVEALLSKEYAAENFNELKPYASTYDAGEISAGETIYLTVADKDGNMISLIQSNYRGMGSGMVPPGLGFMLQDRGELFSLEEGFNNTYEPGKRPFHTIIPAFITKDGAPLMSFGVMGGDFQPQGHAQIVMNMVDYGMNVQEAGDAPRWDHSGGSSPVTGPSTDKGEIHVESGIPYETVRGLMGRGHKVGFARGIYGGYQAIYRDPETGFYHGASESRKDGQAVGY